MVMLALAMTADLDIRFQNAIAADLPSFLVNPSGGLEESDTVSDDLAALDGDGHPTAEEGGAAEAEAGVELPGTARRRISSLPESGSTPTARRSRSRTSQSMRTVLS